MVLLLRNIESNQQGCFADDEICRHIMLRRASRAAFSLARRDVGPLDRLDVWRAAARSFRARAFALRRAAFAAFGCRPPQCVPRGAGGCSTEAAYEHEARGRRGAARCGAQRRRESA